jgi:hypothetical protein
MGDIKKRMATVRAHRFNRYGDSKWDTLSWDALGRAKEYFRTEDMKFLAQAMAEVLFGRQARGWPKGIKTWTDNRHLHLAFAYYEIKREHPKMSDSKIAELLCKHPDFKSDAENLRQRLGKAKREYSAWAEYQAKEYFADQLAETRTERNERAEGFDDS